MMSESKNKMFSVSEKKNRAIVIFDFARFFLLFVALAMIGWFALIGFATVVFVFYFYLHGGL